MNAEILQDSEIADETKMVGLESKSNEDYSVDTFYNAVRFGIRSQVQRILEVKSDLVHKLDEKGFSAVHWAAKRGDVEMLQTLHSFGAPLSLPTAMDARMHPIHWAASDGRIAAIRFFLEKGQDMNIQDANGCTSVIIATQHKHMHSVIFLVRSGADLTLCDNNGDNALHWAAYKGHVELLGYLSYVMKHSVDNQDNFGQTPVHLASLQGQFEAVEYLALDCHADISGKDRNGKTPLDLALSKDKLKVEIFLRRQLFPDLVSFLKSISTRRPMNPRLIGMLLCGSNEKEVAAWPWRIVFLSNFVGSLYTIYFVLHEKLGDLYYLHLLNVSLQFVWWICFLMCLFKSPGFVTDKNSEYEKCLDALCSSNFDKNPAPVVICHTCRVRRPLRSKHCKIQRRCIEKFDHFCPFVGNTVGRDNYFYFVSLLVMHAICGTLWDITAIYLMMRVTVTWFFFFYTIYASLWMLMILGLLHYHIQLIVSSMTTNEHINHMKYPYMVNAFGGIDSPFLKPTAIENVVDALFPSKKDYYSRAEVRADHLSIENNPMQQV